MAAKKSKKMTKAESSAYDKRQAALHEAGHLVVAIATTSFGSAHLSRTSTPNSDTDREWVGQLVQIIPGLMTPEIAAAGFVAESAFADSDDEYDAGDIAFAMRSESLSESDRRHLPSNQSELVAVVESADAFIRRYRRFFDWAVEELVKNEFVNQEEAQFEFDQLYPGQRRILTPEEIVQLLTRSQGAQQR